MNKNLKLALFPLFIAGRILRAPIFFTSNPSFKEWETPLNDVLLISLFLIGWFAPWYVSLLACVVVFGFWLAIIAKGIEEAEAYLDELEKRMYE